MIRLRFLKIIKILVAVFTLSVTSTSLYEAYRFSQALSGPFFHATQFTVEARVYQVIFGLLAVVSASYLIQLIFKNWRDRRS